LENIKNPEILLPTMLSEEGHVWHLFVIRSSRRDDLQKYLAEKGIQTLIHYPIPPHKQEAYEAYNNLSFPITEQIHEEVLSLPLSAIITKEDMNKIVKVLNDY